MLFNALTLPNSYSFSFPFSFSFCFGPIPAIRSKSSGAAHPAGFPLLSGVLKSLHPNRLAQYLSPEKCEISHF